MQDENRKDSIGYRSVLGATAAALSAIGSRPVFARTSAETVKGEQNHSASNPGPINKTLAHENPSSEMPPITDRGNVPPTSYSFDLVHRRIQDGGARTPLFAGSGGRQHASYSRELSRITLADRK